MRSRLPKMLHPLCGVELVCHVLRTVRHLGFSSPVVVVPAESDSIRQVVGSDALVAIQNDPRGTADAVAQARPHLYDQVQALLVVNGDVPLLLPESIARLQEVFLDQQAVLALLTAPAAPSSGLGRVVRDENGRVVRILESLEDPGANDRWSEVNVGAYCFSASWLWEGLKRLTPSQNGELFLTGLVEQAAQQGLAIATVAVDSPEEALGINTLQDLACGERALRGRIRDRWMCEGVTLLDPETTYIDVDVIVGQDTSIWPNTFLLGRTTVAEECVVGPNSLVRDSVIGPRCRVVASVVDDTTLEESVEVGPFSHLRAGAYLGRGSHVGNFGEIKGSSLGPGVKVGHFSYIGDAKVGARANIGAGTITCNFDGQSKMLTEIGEEAFIGSDTLLVAPVSVGRGARTGAGSVVTRDVPADQFAVGMPARVLQRSQKRGRTPLAKLES